jgi:hypothetical protein
VVGNRILPSRCRWVAFERLFRKALFGLSGSLTSNDGSRGVHRNSIQDALKLPRDRTDN